MGNSSEGGSGLFQDQGTVNIINSTISGNQMTREGIGSLGGAGILYQGTGGTGTLNIDHTTITNNTSASNGGGISVFPGITGVVTVTMKNSIIAGNTAGLARPDCWATIDSAGLNILGDDTDCTFNDTIGDQVGTGGSPIDPLLGALADNGGPTQTHALLEGSPAIDAGDCTDIDGNPVTVDQRDVFRPVGPTCDIGSYEAPPPPPKP